MAIFSKMSMTYITTFLCFSCLYLLISLNHSSILETPRFLSVVVCLYHLTKNDILVYFVMYKQILGYLGFEINWFVNDTHNCKLFLKYNFIFQDKSKTIESEESKNSRSGSLTALVWDTGKTRCKLVRRSAKIRWQL